ncbi:DNA polymerase III subunit psi [Vibrio aestuarianus]|nr:DNA polymerase III subunit psi [Vibrio aestuarianus]
MSNHEYQYLQEMGIQYWKLVHPERLLGVSLPTIDLPDSCRLLLVSPNCPQQSSALLFSRVLKSMGIELNDARHLEPQYIDQLGGSLPEWVWFAGCEPSHSEVSAKVLVSPNLSDIEGNNEHRRDLWQQICSYE